MKKIRNALFLILAVLMLLPLATCGASNTPSPVPESTPTGPPADQPVPADITPDPAAEAIDAQLVLLFTDMGRWNQDVSGQAWQYTVTDLDRNGRLELIAAKHDPNSRTTDIRLWEIGADKKSLAECAVEDRDGSFPDIIVEKRRHLLYGQSGRMGIFLL